MDSAIAYVTSENLPRLYALTGHGEESIGSSFTTALTKLNCEYKSLDLMTNESIPEDCDILLINGPSTDLSSDDADKILSYLQHGGSLIATTNFQQAEEMPNWNSVLNYYGLSVSKGVVLENNQGYYYRSNAYLLPDVQSAAETSSVLEGNGYVFMAYAQALEETVAAEDTVSLTRLLTTSDSAYIHSDVTTSTEDFSQTGEDVTGEFLLGVKAIIGGNADGNDTAEDTEEEDTAEEDTEGGSTTEGDAQEADTAVSTAYLFSSVLIFSDGADQMVSGSNASLFSSLVSTLVEENGSEAGISVAAKSVNSSYLTVPTMTAVLVNLLCIVVVPLMLLAGGFVTWLVRRRR